LIVHSYFSGIEGLGTGFQKAGFDVQLCCEIDAKAQTVIRRHLPDAVIIGDIKNAHGTEFGKPDVIVGGFPCQDLSVAGTRSGLSGNRSGLFFELARIIDEARPRVFVLENVPGLLSSEGGKDMETVLRTLVELGYGVAYRVLDSQYFGVAQRRRRVFIVGSLGDGRAAEILFESEGLQRGTEPRRRKGQAAPSLVASGVGVGRTGNSRTESDFLVPEVTATLGTTTSYPGVKNSETDFLVCEAFDANGSGVCHTGDVTQTLLVQSKIGSQIGTNQAVAIMPRWIEREGNVPNGTPASEDVAFTLDCEAKPQAVAFDQKEIICIHPHAIGRDPKNGPAYRDWSEEPGYTLDTLDTVAPMAVAFSQNQRDEVREMDVVGALAAEPGMKQQTFIKQGFRVRRLMPVECERLQGFPDGWTESGVKSDGTIIEHADSSRYKMCGNAVTVNVAAWIAHRIKEVMF
jgi:DNA (cytosine-5)-methyltransferase 1